MDVEVADPNSPIRVQFTINEYSAKDPRKQSKGITAENVRSMAKSMGVPELEDYTAADIKTDGERSMKRDAIRNLIADYVLSRPEVETRGGYSLHSDKEQFFQSVRNKIRQVDGKDTEKKSQADAIRQLFDIEKDQPLVMSELQLVNKAVEVARLQSRRPDYSIDDLIREGVAMISQSLISKHLAVTNSSQEIAPKNIAGRKDNEYLEALNELRALHKDPIAWQRKYRGDKITVSALARRANTGDAQIRGFIERNCIVDVYDPRANK